MSWRGEPCLHTTRCTHQNAANRSATSLLFVWSVVCGDPQSQTQTQTLGRPMGDRGCDASRLRDVESAGNQRDTVRAHRS